MMILIIGTPDSGKSVKAEEVTLTLSEDNKRIYLATMIPYGEEGIARIGRHKALREGKGFITVERSGDIADTPDADGCIAGIPASEATVLLECTANLCANLLFDDTGNLTMYEDEAVKSVTEDIIALNNKVKNLIVVTNEFKHSDEHDNNTISYINVMSDINEILRTKADKIYDVTEGTWKIYEND